MNIGAWWKWGKKNPPDFRAVDPNFWEHKQQATKSLLSKLKDIRDRSKKWSDEDLKEIVESIYLLNDQNLQTSLNLDKVEKIFSKKFTDLCEEIDDLKEQVENLSPQTEDMPRNDHSFFKKLFR